MSLQSSRTIIHPAVYEKGKLVEEESYTVLPQLQQPQSYPDGRTKQSYKDECDINKIMARAEKGGTISHLAKYEAVYGDFSDFDFQEQTQKLTRGREIFDDLPAELRQEFGQSPAKFFEYVNDPANAGDLRRKLPPLSAPGRQLPKVGVTLADEAARAAASELASENSALTDEASAVVTPTD